MSNNKRRLLMTVDIEGVSEAQVLEYSKKLQKQLSKWKSRSGVVDAQAITRPRRGDSRVDLENMKLRA